MKKISVLIAVLLTASSASFSQTRTDNMVKNIHWFKQASVKIDTGTMRIFIDPINITSNEKADIILITHNHDDHFSPADIEKLSKDDTVIVTSFNTSNLKMTPMVLLPNQNVTIKDIKIETVPAYNIVKTNFHPKSKNFVGYIITVDGIRIYHAGDTERIPEMKKFSCDIALLPLGQTYTMNSVDDAIHAALDVKAKIAIPIHFGMYEGTENDAKHFVNELTKKNVKAVILEQEK